MADKSFGVKELNLLNASGTPTVTSPNNLNLNANTVAISTSCTIGNNLTVTGGTSLSNLIVSGITTFSAGNTVDVRGNFTVSGISTIPQPADSNPMANWTITNNSASAYRFTGPGQSGTEDNPNIYLVRGHRYIFKHNATSSHPIQIRFANGGAAYTDGITYSEGNNTTTDGNNLIFNVQHDAPAHLFYQCTSHGGMVGNIYIVGQHLANGANNRVLTATSAYGINAESNMTFDGDDLTISHSGLAVNIFESTDNHSRLRIKSGSSSLTQLEFADQDDADAGEIRYDHGSDVLSFHVGSNAEKFRIKNDGIVCLDNTTGAIVIGDNSAPGITTAANGNTKMYFRSGTHTQTSATTDMVQISLYDQNSKRNGTESSGSWKSKIQFLAAQMNGGVREGAFIQQDIKYNNFSGGATKMRADLVFATRGDAETSSNDPASEKLRINHRGEMTMSNAATTEFIQVSTTGNTTRGVISLAGKDGSGNAVTLKMGGFGDTSRGEIFTHSNHALGFATNNAATQMMLDTNGNLVVGHTAANAKLHIASGTSSAVGDATNPAFQIGATGNYRFAIHTTNEAAIIANKNGDDGIQIHTKLGNTGNSGIGEAQRFHSRGYRESRNYNYGPWAFVNDTWKSTITVGDPGDNKFTTIKLILTLIDGSYRQNLWQGEYTIFASNAAGGPGVNYYLKEHWQHVGSGNWSGGTVSVAITSGGALQVTADNGHDDAAGNAYIHILDVIGDIDGSTVASISS